MALTKNKISIPFSAGLETKTDDSQNQLGGLRVLENVLFDTPKKLLKRKGYNNVSLKDITDTDISNAKFLARFEDELGLMTDSNYYTYSESINRWSNKGQVFTAFPTSETVVRNNREQKNIDVTNIENINVFSYEDSTGVRVSMVDSSNNNNLISDELISASTDRDWETSRLFI